MKIGLIEGGFDNFLDAIPVTEDTLKSLARAVEFHGYELDVHLNSDIAFVVKKRAEGSIIIESFILSQNDWLVINASGYMQKMTNQFVTTTWNLDGAPPRASASL